MNFQPYLFDPRGDGVRAPIRQTAAKGIGGLLPPNVAAKLYARRHAKPNAFASTITSRYNVSHVEPSSFSQMGRGRAQIKRSLGVTRSKHYHPLFGGSYVRSDPLKLHIGGKHVYRGGLVATRNAIINPGSY